MELIVTERSFVEIIPGAPLLVLPIIAALLTTRVASAAVVHIYVDFDVLFKIKI